MDFLIQNPVQNNYYNIINNTNNINDISYTYLQKEPHQINNTYTENTYDFPFEKYPPQNYYFPNNSGIVDENYGVKYSLNISGKSPTYCCNDCQNKNIPSDNANSIINNKKESIDKNVNKNENPFKNSYVINNVINATNEKENNKNIKEKTNNYNYYNQANITLNMQNNSNKNNINQNNSINTSVNKNNYKLTIIDQTSKVNFNKNKIPNDVRSSIGHISNKCINSKSININDNNNINNIKNINNYNSHDNIYIKKTNSNYITDTSNYNSNNYDNLNLCINNNMYNNNYNNNNCLTCNNINNDLDSVKLYTKIVNHDNSTIHSKQKIIKYKSKKDSKQTHYYEYLRKSKIADNTNKYDNKLYIKHKSTSNLMVESYKKLPEKLKENNICRTENPKKDNFLRKKENKNLIIHKEKNEKNFEKKILSNTCQNTENFINNDYKYYPKTARNNNTNNQENSIIKEDNVKNGYFLTEVIKDKKKNSFRKKIKKINSNYLTINKTNNDISSINVSTHKINLIKNISLSNKKTKSPSTNSANKENNYNSIIKKKKINIFSSYKNFGNLKLGEKNEDRFSHARKDEFLGGGKKDKFIGRIKKDLEKIKKKRNIKEIDNSLKLGSSKSNNFDRLTINSNCSNDNNCKIIQKTKSNYLSKNYYTIQKKDKKLNIRNNNKNLNTINSYSNSSIKINNKLISEGYLNKYVKSLIFQSNKDKDINVKSHNNLNLYGYFDKINLTKSIKNLPIENIDHTKNKEINKRLYTSSLNNKIITYTKKNKRENTISHKKNISKNKDNISNYNKNNFPFKISYKIEYPSKNKSHKNLISSQKNIENDSKKKSKFFTRKTVGRNETSVATLYDIKKSDKVYNQKFRFRPRSKGKYNKSNISIDVNKKNLSNSIFKFEKKKNANNQIFSYDNLDVKNMLNKINDNNKNEEENVPYLNVDDSENTNYENNDNNKLDNKNYILDLNNVIPINETELFYKMFIEDDNNINKDIINSSLSKFDSNNNTNANKENNKNENFDKNYNKTNDNKKIIEKVDKNKNEFLLEPKDNIKRNLDIDVNKKLLVKSVNIINKQGENDDIYNFKIK